MQDLKNMYGRKRKNDLLPLEDFDPRPPESKGAKLEEFLGKVRGKGLGVSLLFDQTMQYWNDDKPESEIPTLPTSDSLNYNINEFIKTFNIGKLKEKQQFSSLWYDVRKYRLTASNFGEVFNRKPDTPPDALVLRLLQQHQISSPAIEWGTVPA